MARGQGAHRGAGGAPRRASSPSSPRSSSPSPTCRTRACRRAPTRPPTASSARWASRRRFDFAPKAALGPRAGARHPRLRARRQGRRRALHRLLRRRRRASSGAHRLHARPPHPRARLHRGAAAVHRQRATRCVGTGQLPKFEKDLFQLEGYRLLPGADRRGAAHQPPPRRDPRRGARCRSATPPTRPASAARPAPTARTCAA